MQEVAFKLVTKLETLRDVEAFRPWLRRIIINICRGSAREQKPTLSLEQADRGSDPMDAIRGRGPVPAAPDEPADAIPARREAAKRLMKQVQTLPPEYREPLLLRCVRQMTYEQISILLELPITTIETRLARARRMLREEVGGILSDMRETGV